MNGNLTGNRHVRAIRPAFDDVGRLCRRTREKIEIRSHALKLRYWPQMHPTDDSGQLLDLDWSWIRAMEGQRVGELRLNDTIGGNDNLRIIFYEADALESEGMAIIWVLRVMQKKRDDFTRNDIAIFKGRRTLVIERFYKNRM